METKKITELTLAVIVNINGEKFGGEIDLLKTYGVENGILNWEIVRSSSENLLVSVHKTLQEHLKDTSIKME